MEKLSESCREAIDIIIADKIRFKAVVKEKTYRNLPVAKTKTI